MKRVRDLGFGLFVLGFVVLISSASFAEGKNEKADISLFRNAAAALQATHADLSAGLTKYANEEAKEKLEKKGEKTEKEGAAEEKDEKAKQERRVATLKLFRDSAAALQPTNPALAAGLRKAADRKEKWLKENKEGKEGKEDTEKAEAQEVKHKK